MSLCAKALGSHSQRTSRAPAPSTPAHEAFGAEGDKHLGVPGGSDLELDLTILQIRANKGKIRDESRGAPPPKEGEEDTAHIFGEEPRWPDEL